MGPEAGAIPLEPRFGQRKPMPENDIITSHIAAVGASGDGSPLLR
jgi:hypothetical protein